MLTDLKNFKSALLSTFMITRIKSAILKMYINAGSVSSSLKSKHRIFFCTLLLNVIKYTCFLYIVLRDTRLGRLYKMSAECTTKRKSSIHWGNSTYGFRHSGGGESVQCCLPCPSLGPFVRILHRKASK